MHARYRPVHFCFWIRQASRTLTREIETCPWVSILPCQLNRCAIYICILSVFDNLWSLGPTKCQSVILHRTAGLVVICKCVRAVDFKASCLKRLMNLTAIKSRGRTQNSRLTIKSPQCSIIGFHTYVTLVNPNWHELRKQEKFSSLAPPRGIFIRLNEPSRVSK